MRLRPKTGLIVSRAESAAWLHEFIVDRLYAGDDTLWGVEAQSVFSNDKQFAHVLVSPSNDPRPRVIVTIQCGSVYDEEISVSAIFNGEWDAVGGFVDMALCRVNDEASSLQHFIDATFVMLSLPEIVRLSALAA